MFCLFSLFLGCVVFAYVLCHSMYLNIITQKRYFSISAASINYYYIIIINDGRFVYWELSVPCMTLTPNTHLASLTFA